MGMIQAAFEQLVRYAILFMELIGVIVMVISATKALVGLYRRDAHMRLNLAEGIALALEFKLGAEVLRTLVVRTLDELIMLGAVVLLRAAIAVLIQWGIKREEDRLEDDEREELNARRAAAAAAPKASVREFGKPRRPHGGNGRERAGKRGDKSRLDRPEPY